MSDPLSTALQSVKMATDVVRILRTAEGGFERAELKLQIANLAEALANARLGILDAQVEIAELKRRITDLKANAERRATVIRRRNLLYSKSEAAEEGPYCTRCFEIDDRLVSLSMLPAGFRDLCTYECPHCKSLY